MDFNFFSPINVKSGKNCVIKNSALLREFGEKCLIVTGGTSAKKSGALDDVVVALSTEDIDWLIYDKITENPRLDHCHEAGRLAFEERVDFIVGIGGGSPLDAALFDSKGYDLFRKGRLAICRLLFRNRPCQALLPPLSIPILFFLLPTE